jgi:hypothetical protein
MTSHHLKIILGEIQKILENFSKEGNEIKLKNFKEILKMFSSYLLENLERIQYIYLPLFKS